MQTSADGPEAISMPTTVDEALAIVRQRGGRITSSRRLLLEALFSAPGHWTAEELAEEVQGKAPDVHLSTIYRNLEELERVGIIVHTHLGHGPTSYHPASSVHGHFVCDKCGTMIEVPPTLFAELARTAARDYGFITNPHHFAVPGRCRDCS